MRNEVKIGRLDNGFKFYSQYDWSSSVHLAGIGVKAGSLHTPPGCVGLPHLVEHLLARESLKYAPLQAEMIFEKYLGDPDEDINIRIDRVSTFYGFGDLLKKEGMMACLDVMAGFLRDKIITAEGIDVEKAAVHNEYYLRGVDLMWSLIDDLMHGLIYERNPARFRIDCEVDDLKGTKRSQIASFIRKHYVPENMFLVVFGPRFEEVRELAKRYFDDLKNRPRPALDYDQSDNLPVLASIRSNEIERAGIGQFHFALGFPTESYMSKDAEALDVLARILAFRLRQRLREGNRIFNQGVYRANVYTSRSFLHGLIYATFATISGEFALKGENIVLEEIQKLKEELVGDTELDAMVNYIDNSYLDAFKKIALTLSEMVIEAVCNGDEDLTRLHSFRQRLHKITRKKLCHIANKYLGDNYARVLVRPV